MKHAITLLAFFGLMSSPLAMAAISAKINAIPGALIVNWQPQDAGQCMGDALEVYNDTVDLLAWVPAKMSGQQPAKIQGGLRMSPFGKQLQYRVQFGFGGEIRNKPLIPFVLRFAGRLRLLGLPAFLLP